MGNNTKKLHRDSKGRFMKAPYKLQKRGTDGKFIKMNKIPRDHLGRFIRKEESPLTSETVTA